MSCHEYRHLRCKGCPYEDKDYACANQRKQFERDARLYEIETALADFGVEYKKVPHGYLLFPKGWILTPHYKWRTKHNPKWYSVKDARTLLEKYYISGS